MMKSLALTLALSTSVLAQGLDPLRNVSGTTSNPGGESLWVRSEPTAGGWTFFHGFDAHVTYVSETGPEEQRNEVFSTNWFGAGLHTNFGDRGFALVRGRVSLEPYTLPEDEGYPQILQYVSPEGGGPVVDRMRAHDLIGEAALQVGWRPTQSTLLSVYGALVGDPALGTAPSALRASGVDFAEAPFSYDIQEIHHDSTSVVTAGFATRWITLEGSVFHDAISTGEHTELDNGDIDSRSARVTLTPTPAVSIQFSRGELGEDLLQHDITSASFTYGSPFVAATALWTRREHADEIRPSETAYGFELALRGTRNSFIGRAEWVDRPGGFPEHPDVRTSEQTTHFAVGYIFDFLTSNRYRAGIGVNIDYHTQSHDLEDRYGHKPQSIYAFARFRTGAR
ncbi:MAG TPA: hypothetical protein VEK79_07500 [Thermoanaerobaculia bacterium]|nr:hypothetical protein [Thermoanaerobaculia bacterium]